MHVTVIHAEIMELVVFSRREDSTAIACRATKVHDVKSILMIARTINVKTMAHALMAFNRTRAAVSLASRVNFARKRFNSAARTSIHA
jgi:hypothetical protein